MIQTDNPREVYFLHEQCQKDMVFYVFSDTVGKALASVREKYRGSRVNE